jgi:hypothetical protein
MDPAHDLFNHFIIRSLYAMQNDAVQILQRPLRVINRQDHVSNSRAYEFVAPIAGVLERSTPIPPFTADVLSKTLGVMVLYLRVMEAYQRPVSETDLRDIRLNNHNINIFIEHLIQTGKTVTSVHEHYCACLKRAMAVVYPEHTRLHDSLKESIRHKIKSLKREFGTDKSVPKPPLMVHVAIDTFDLRCRQRII